MNNTLAQFFSYLLHPVFMPLIGIYVALNLIARGTGIIWEGTDTTIYGIFFVNTVILPIFSLYVLKRQKVISDFKIADKKERIVPFIVTLIYYVLTYSIFRSIDSDLKFPLLAVMTGGIVSIALATLITRYWKISIHMVGIGGITGILMGFAGTYSFPITTMVCLSFILAGILGYARLFLNAHNQQQVVAGFMLGALCEFIPINFDLFI